MLRCKARLAKKRSPGSPACLSGSPTTCRASRENPSEISHPVGFRLHGPSPPFVGPSISTSSRCRAHVQSARTMASGEANNLETVRRWSDEVGLGGMRDG